MLQKAIKHAKHNFYMQFFIALNNVDITEADKYIQDAEIDFEFDISYEDPVTKCSALLVCVGKQHFIYIKQLISIGEKRGWDENEWNDFLNKQDLNSNTALDILEIKLTKEQNIDVKAELTTTIKLLMNKGAKNSRYL